MIALAVVADWGWMLQSGLAIALIIYLTYRLWLDILKM